jgi:hypothetical protein
MMLVTISLKLPPKYVEAIRFVPALLYFVITISISVLLPEVPLYVIS